MSNIIPIPTRRINAGDDIVALLTQSISIRHEDIIVISSKAIATAENVAMKLSSLVPSKEALMWSAKCGQDPRFTEAILRESKRMNGQIERASSVVLLTSLRPEGMQQGRILCPNAGLDQSNIEHEHVIGWPVSPVESAERLRQAVERHSGGRNAVIISDSCCSPGRIGVTAFALVTAGIEPLRSCTGIPDLFGRKLRMTSEAIADQLATMANTVMGNAAESIPAALIRDHGMTLSDVCGWVPGIEPKDDIFGDMRHET